MIPPMMPAMITPFARGQRLRVQVGTHPPLISTRVLGYQDRTAQYEHQQHSKYQFSKHADILRYLNCNFGASLLLLVFEGRPVFT
jgi:hypothetical protein